MLHKVPKKMKISNLFVFFLINVMHLKILPKNGFKNGRVTTILLKKSAQQESGHYFHHVG